MSTASDDLINYAPCLFICPHIDRKHTDSLGMEILCFRGDLGIADSAAAGKRKQQKHRYRQKKCLSRHNTRPCVIIQPKYTVRQSQTRELMPAMI